MKDRAPERQDTLPTDQEIRERHTQNPDAMRRAKEAAERARRGEPAGPGLTREELADFLREQG